LNQMRLLSFRGWVRSLLHRQTFAFFRWDDPFPALFDSIRLVMLWRKLESSGSAVATTSSEFSGAPQSMQRDAIPLRD